MKFSNISFVRIKAILVVGLVCFLAACSSNKGGFYKNDGPGKRNVDIDSIPNAVPKNEPFVPTTLNPYEINGKTYVPLKSTGAYLEEGRASWYGRRYHGKKTSTGEVYDMFKMTAAHPTLPLPSYARVTNVTNQRSVIVRLNDRGPFLGNRIIDLSYVAAKKLGVVSAGTGNVIVESLSPSAIYQNSQPVQAQQPSQLTSQTTVSSAVTAQPLGAIPPATVDNSPNPEFQSRPNVANQQLPQLIENEQPPQGQAPNQPINPPQATTDFANDQWVQVGAFSVSKNAEDLLSRLKLSGYANSQIISQNALFKVLVGPLDANESAETIRSLKSNGYSAIKAQR